MGGSSQFWFVRGDSLTFHELPMPGAQRTVLTFQRAKERKQFRLHRWVLSACYLKKPMEAWNWDLRAIRKFQFMLISHAREPEGRSSDFCPASYNLLEGYIMPSRRNVHLEELLAPLQACVSRHVIIHSSARPLRVHHQRRS